MALGASRRDVVRLITGEGLRLTAAGVAVGLAAAAAGARVLSSLLFEVQPTDAVTYAAAAAVLTLIAMTATAVPAWRATRVAPMSALRSE
jgi:ABC-type antimicrobial peptide transport system permease subunit